MPARFVSSCPALFEPLRANVALGDDRRSVAVHVALPLLDNLRHLSRLCAISPVFLPPPVNLLLQSCALAWHADHLLMPKGLYVACPPLEQSVAQASLSYLTYTKDILQFHGTRQSLARSVTRSIAMQCSKGMSLCLFIPGNPITLLSQSSLLTRSLEDIHKNSIQNYSRLSVKATQASYIQAQTRLLSWSISPTLRN